MKKIYTLATALCLSLVLAGCGNSTSQPRQQGSTTKTVSDVLQERIEQENSQNEVATIESNDVASNDNVDVAKNSEDAVTEETLDTTTPQPNVLTGEYDHIDIDFTQMSSTVAYSELFNMQNNPQDYIGKVVKMSGTENTMGMEVQNGSGRVYHAVFIKDAAACCQNGFEYLIGDDTIEDYHHTYPAQDQPITVTGIFSTYEEEGFIYCRLGNAVVK